MAARALDHARDAVLERMAVGIRQTGHDDVRTGVGDLRDIATRGPAKLGERIGLHGDGVGVLDRHDAFILADVQAHMGPPSCLDERPASVDSARQPYDTEMPGKAET